MGAEAIYAEFQGYRYLAGQRPPFPEFIKVLLFSVSCMCTRPPERFRLNTVKATMDEDLVRAAERVRNLLLHISTLKDRACKRC